MENRQINPARIHWLSGGRPGSGPVVYWMSRSQRMNDNWALLYASARAAELNRPLVVFFFLYSCFRGAAGSHFSFMLEGLKETARELEKKNISFYIIHLGKNSIYEDAVKHGETMAALFRQAKIAELIVDFDPLREKQKTHGTLASSLNIPVAEVDSRNIVPVWSASNKQEYAARTIRPKILKQLPLYLEEFPVIGGREAPAGIPPNQRLGTEEAGSESDGIRKAHNLFKSRSITWSEADKTISSLPSGPDLSWIIPGEDAALEAMREFIGNRLPGYDENRNNPNLNAASMLSPYLHFGQISAARIALEINHAAEQSPGLWQDADSFLEELIVRRELAENFCYHNPRYDSVEGFPTWGLKTLMKHSRDSREYLYTLEQLEEGKTHDDLWNTAQARLVQKGTMHGYLRMYWAKKILEWTETPARAMEYAIYLNDSYQLDGRDPNGYTGIAWAVGGVHDRPWKEREIFGTVRYMNYKGCKRKFNVVRYVAAGGEP